MLRRTAAAHHHTPEEVAGYLSAAILILDKETLTDEERAAVLPTIVQLLSQVQTQFEMMGPLAALPNGLRP